MNSFLRSLFCAGLVLGSNVAFAGGGYQLEKLAEMRERLVAHNYESDKCLFFLESLVDVRSNAILTARTTGEDVRALADFRIPNSRETCGISYAEFKAKEIKKSSVGLLKASKKMNDCDVYERILTEAVGKALRTANAMGEDSSPLQNLRLANCR